MNAVFVFAGQGAQKVGMGKDLCSSNAAAAVFKEADEVLGWSVSEVCFDGPVEKLTESTYCQVAIYTMSVACLEAFKERYPDVKSLGNGGLSLGEFTALYASGVFTFADGLRLVAERAKLMDAACKATNGGMASVLGGDIDIISEVCSECGIDVANYNCPGQIVISGEKDGVAKAVTTLKERGLRKVIPLKVAGAFHSSLMKDAGERLGAVLETIPMNKPSTPIVQNFTGSVVGDNIDHIKQNLVNQVAGSVRWEECVRTLIAGGGDTVIEFGPGSVLTSLLKRTDKGVKGCNIGTLDNLDAFIQ